MGIDRRALTPEPKGAAEVGRHIRTSPHSGETTVDQLTLCVFSLLVNPELTALPRTDVSLIPTAVAEIVRVSPAMSVLFHRVATQRMTTAGQILARGSGGRLRAGRQPQHGQRVPAGHHPRSDLRARSASVRRAEDGRHSIAIRDFPRTSRAADPDELERPRTAHTSARKARRRSDGLA